MEIERLRPHELPPELRRLPQWVVWRLESRHGRQTKVPYRPRAEPPRRASTADPSTWGTLGAALLARRERQGFDGIGFVFTARDPVVGLDLDGPRDPETGELEPWAQDLVARLSSYTELSPSQRGLHVLALGEPLCGRRKGRVELYGQGRFFTITGLHLAGTPRRLELRRAELEAIHAELSRGREGNRPTLPSLSRPPLDLDDEGVLERAFAGRNGRRLRSLWGGGWAEAGYPSQSEADLALCNALYFYTGGDRERTDRLFRRSSLHRAKWDERRAADGRTYGGLTLDIVERTRGSMLSSEQPLWERAPSARSSYERDRRPSVL